MFFLWVTRGGSNMLARTVRTTLQFSPAHRSGISFWQDTVSSHRSADLTLLAALLLLSMALLSPAACTTGYTFHAHHFLTGGADWLVAQTLFSVGNTVVARCKTAAPWQCVHSCLASSPADWHPVMAHSFNDCDSGLYVWAVEHRLS
jgi:hypothetical protein